MCIWRPVLDAWAVESDGTPRLVATASLLTRGLAQVQTPRTSSFRLPWEHLRAEAVERSATESPGSRTSQGDSRGLVGQGREYPRQLAPEAAPSAQGCWRRWARRDVALNCQDSLPYRPTVSLPTPGGLVSRASATAKTFGFARMIRDTWLAWPARVGPLLGRRSGFRRRPNMRQHRSAPSGRTDYLIASSARVLRLPGASLEVVPGRSPAGSASSRGCATRWRGSARLRRAARRSVRSGPRPRRDERRGAAAVARAVMRR